MALEKRNLHLKLQEYCDCYLEADPKKELELISREGLAADVTGDPTELALKFLGVTILYGLNEKVEEIKLTRKEDGKTKVKVKGPDKYTLPSPPPRLADKVMEVVRSITYLDAPKASEPLALGIRNESVELGIEVKSKEDKQSLKISFPEW
jgi:hypothetical protein